MKAISLCQPWAWAITHGPKRVENRTRPTRYRGPLLIHASKSRRYFTDDTLRLLEGLGLRLPDVDDFVYGAIVAYTQLHMCWPAGEVRRYLSRGVRHWRMQEPFIEGPYCLVCGDVRILAKPVPYRGQRGLFDVPDELITLTNRACRVCGCTDERACPDGCHWVEPNLCSACVAEGTPWPMHPGRLPILDHAVPAAGVLP